MSRARELHVEQRAVADLVPYARNARTHTPEQVAQIAASITAFGWTNPILVDEAGGVIAGHGRLEAAKSLAMATVPVISLAGLSETERRALVLADNKLALNAGWDFGLLSEELAALDVGELDVALIGFSDAELEQIATWSPPAVATALRQGLTAPDVIPLPPAVVTSARGDIWELGAHRVMCGDSTVAAEVDLLVDGDGAPLLHADPPYGMGKEVDGVLNDNLYRANLDAFQMRWWRAWRPHLADNASVYIWGTADNLWRLWYSGSLVDSERMTFRNEVVWDKVFGIGMSSDTHRQYATATERLLFFMLGEQGFGNINVADYWEGFEPIRAYLEAEVKRIGYGTKDIARICGVGMYGHWFTKSQWVMIPAKHYRALQQAADGEAFTRPYHELRELYDGGLADASHLGAKREFYALRAHFNNTHDNMTDVWRFPRVLGEERYGHATPKPVDLCVRAVRSSAPAESVVLEPFGGTGSTLIACEQTGNPNRTMGLEPAFVDVTVLRWQAFTGEAATLAGDGRTFAELAAERAPAAVA